MKYKQLAEDALDVAKNTAYETVRIDHMARAQVYATLALVEALDGGETVSAEPIQWDLKL